MAGESATRTTALKRILLGAALGAVVGAAWSRLQRAHTSVSTPGLHEWIAGREAAGYSAGILISILLFVIFSIYWEIAAASAAETKIEESHFSRGIHLTLVTLGQILLLIPVPILRMRFLPQAKALAVIGLAIEVVSLSFAVWARQRLGRNWSGAVAIKEDQQLIRSGPYRLVRHPIYSAMLGAYAGILVISGEVHALLGMILICLAYWRKIRLEERYLSNVFGPAYDDYRSSTSAVIPGML